MRTMKEILGGAGYSENQIERFLAKCYLDYCYFAKYVLGFDIAEYHQEWFELAQKFKRLSLIAFRGSGKTHFFCGFFIWKAIFSKDKNFLIVAHQFDSAKFILKVIRTLISNNEYLKEFIPQSREVAWRATELTLKSGAIFYCKTYGEGVRGLRIDYCLCDEAGEYEDKSIFWADISPVVQLNRGNIIVIGTAKSPIDLLHELLDNTEYFSKKYPAETDGVPLWPQKYTEKPFDYADKRSLVGIRKEIGELTYMQEYLLIPISSANSLFPYTLTAKALANNERFLAYGKKSERYYIGYDVAISPKGDYTVMSVLGVNSDRKFLVKGLRFRDNFTEQKKKLGRLYEDFKPEKIFVDGTGLGEFQVQNLQGEFSGLQVIKFTYEEKYKILLDLRQEFENYNITLPNAKDDEAYAFTQNLLKELSDFSLKVDLRPGQTVRPKFHSGRYDDCVISLALANKASQKIYGQLNIEGLEL
jgi:phage terminase large subunit-like protein